MTKRQILEELKRDELIAAVDRYELPVADRRSRALLVTLDRTANRGHLAEGGRLGSRGAVHRGALDGPLPDGDQADLVGTGRVGEGAEASFEGFQFERETGGEWVEVLSVGKEGVAFLGKWMGDGAMELEHALYDAERAARPSCADLPDDTHVRRLRRLRGPSQLDLDCVLRGQIASLGDVVQPTLP